MIELIQGFNVGSKEPIDKRIVISSSDIAGLSSEKAAVMPDRYIALCKNDGLFYVYDKEENLFRKASDFVDTVSAVYYDGDEAVAESIISAGTGGNFKNYKKAVVDSNEIVKRSGLSISLEVTGTKVKAKLLDAEGELIAESSAVDVPLDWTSVTGYDASKTQILKNEGGTIRWV